MLELKVKYFTDIEPIKFIENKSDWYDLRAAEEIEMKAGDFRLIKLGIGIKLPEGFEALIAPRSSTFKNYGIIQAQSIGVVDESYSGDNDQWMMPAIALRDTVIHKNDRICQFRIIQHQPPHTIKTVEHLDDTDRGGIGSTGKQ
ncbi:MAG: deoxyuridine 5'-triphosphate nucleotidohydrolase [Clostridia bacterium]|nr:deoxyuridine 5'-triphosphate nucleotidohydrolase [Clostridia bacterium]